MATIKERMTKSSVGRELRNLNKRIGDIFAMTDWQAMREYKDHFPNYDLHEEITVNEARRRLIASAVHYVMNVYDI